MTTRWDVAAGGTALITLICWADYVTGPRLGLSLFYIVPVVVAAWLAGTRVAVFVAIYAGIAWTTADFAWADEHDTLFISMWNAFTRFVIYISMAVLVSVLHTDRERLRALAERESELARTDRLTGLLNVRGFIEAAGQMIRTVRRSGEPLALVYLDLDNFKRFNDRLGHAAGDAILEEVGRILKTSLSAQDFGGRLGGDEFAALIAGRRAEEAERWAQETVAAIQRIGAPYPDVAFGATAGVAFHSTAPVDAEQLLRAGDDAMYQGKLSGRGSVIVTRPEVQAPPEPTPEVTSEAS